MWDRIRAANLPSEASDPFNVLGVSREDSDAKIKAAHRELVRRMLGQPTNKGETRTDWRKRPLSPAQIDYALDDVRHLDRLR